MLRAWSPPPSPSLKRSVRRLAPALDPVDGWTRRHCKRVSELCDGIALGLGLGERRRERLRLTAAVHDIGKVLIPDAILQKPGRLDDAEFAVMRRHSEIGHRLLCEDGLWEEAAWVRHHHERVDGNGYPDGLRGEQIPLESRIIFVADAFEAMTAERPYAPARLPGEAMAELERNAGTQFDARCVAALREALFAPVPTRRGRLRPRPAAGCGLGLSPRRGLGPRS